MHTDPELLALLALGEHVGSEDERGHAGTCPECAAEVAELRRVVTLGRSAGDQATLVSPGADLWTRISDELALDPAVAPPEPLAADLDAASTAGSPRELTARARLAPVSASWSAASGTAEMAIDGQGRRLLQVALSAELPTSGVRQAWLVHRSDPSRRQTLGILDGPNGLWTVEQSIDLEEYGILDISQQRTGETEHSGHTIVRGELALVS